MSNTKEFELDGIITTGDISEEEFFQQFIELIESKGWSYGGKMLAIPVFEKSSDIDHTAYKRMEKEWETQHKEILAAALAEKIATLKFRFKL